MASMVTNSADEARSEGDALEAGEIDPGDVALDPWPQDEERWDAGGISDGSSLTLYLKEIRAIPLLPHAREIELSKEREEGESRALDHLLSCPLALQHALHLGERVQSGELPIEQAVEANRDRAFGEASESEASLDAMKNPPATTNGRRARTPRT